ncbi:MAG: methylenetetrahydrofolate reductase [Armatimonadota bacterium]|nr:methylenetetrahydrofolate reductase [Armatimonadota bacterium]
MSLADKLGKKFVMTVEIDPPRGVDITKPLQKAELLRQFDAVDIADSPMARVRMSPVALAHLIRERIGIETILHMTCRDRNLLSLQSDLLGAYALGIQNVLALTGDPPSVGDYPNATGVFDVKSEGLVSIISRLNSGTDLAGNKLSESPSFCIGVAVNPTANDPGKEIDRLKVKRDMGANFALTQPVYSMDELKAFMDKAQTVQVEILVGILPLRNPRHCEFLHNEVPGITIPDSVRARMRDAGEEGGREEGIAIAAEFLTEAKSLVSGAYFMPPFGDYEMAVQAAQVAF